MAYNNGFPVNYQPMYYPQQYQQPVQMQQPTQPQQNVIWVQGEAAARGYLMAPNTTLPLWDSEANVIYLKSTDAAGMPSMKVLDYTIRNQTPVNAPVAASPAPTINSQDYALRTDLEALAGQINALRAEIDGLAAKRPTQTRKKEEE